MGGTDKISIHASWRNDGHSDLDARCSACGQWFWSWGANEGPGYGSATLAELNRVSDTHQEHCKKIRKGARC